MEIVQSFKHGGSGNNWAHVNVYENSWVVVAYMGVQASCDLSHIGVPAKNLTWGIHLVNNVNKLMENCRLEAELKKKKHPKCLGHFDYWGEFDCDYYTVLTCDECKYGGGRKDPKAKCNQIK